MRTQDTVIGGFSVVWTRERRRFAPEELRLAEAIARQAAVAVENARTLEAQRALERRQSMLVALGRELSAEVELPRLLRRIAGRSAELLGADAALLLLLEGEDLRVRGAVGIEDAIRAVDRLRVDPSLTGVVRERRPLVSPDLATDETWRDTPLVRRSGYRAMLAVPLVWRDCALGVLTLLHRGPRVFDTDDVGFLEAVATEAAMAIENTRLLDEATRSRREAETIAEVARTINASLDLDTTLERVTRAARRLCGSDVAAIALREPDTGQMTIRHPIGSTWQGIRIEPGRGSGGYVLATGRPFRTSDYARDERVTHDHLAAVEKEGVTVQLVVPIVKDGRIEGLLYAANRSTRPFTGRDEAALVRLASHAALAIGNTQAFAREQRARAEAEASRQRFEDLVQSLDAIVWEGDPTGPRLRLTFVSRSAETILGYPVERWLSEPGFMSQHLHPDDRDAALALGRAATAEGRDHQVEYRMLTADGHVVWFHDSATFRIYVPSVEPMGQAPPEERAPRERGTETILLVEDEEGVRDLAHEILEGEGYRVLGAPHPSDALEVAERHAGPIHLLLTDVVMPSMSGTELAARVVERQPSAKVLYISGYTEGGVPGRAFLAKPFTPDTLLSKVREVLQDQPAS